MIFILNFKLKYLFKKNIFLFERYKVFNKFEVKMWNIIHLRDCMITGLQMAIICLLLPPIESPAMKLSSFPKEEIQ